MWNMNAKLSTDFKTNQQTFKQNIFQQQIQHVMPGFPLYLISSNSVVSALYANLIWNGTPLTITSDQRSQFEFSLLTRPLIKMIGSDKVCTEHFCTNVLSPGKANI